MTGPAHAFHWSPEDPLCPLCGRDLGLPPSPTQPCETLAALTRHFGADCPATERIVPTAPPTAPRGRLHPPRTGG